MKGLEWIIGLALVATGAWLYPELGVSLSRWPVTTAAVVLIFFFSGLRIELRLVLKGIKNWRFQVRAQLLIFGVMPFLFWLFSFFFDGPTRVGVLLTGCLPTTISSCVVLSSLIGGDEEGALSASLLSNVLALFLAPLLLMFYLSLGNMPEFLIGEAIGKLLLVILAPLLLGRAVRFFYSVSKQIQSQIPFWNSLLIFFLAYIALCKVFYLSVPIGKILLCMGAFHALLLFIVHLVIRRFLKRAEQIALLFTSTQKSLAIGVPLISFLGLPGSEFVVAPLVAYHFVQLLIPGLFILK